MIAATVYAADCHLSSRLLDSLSALGSTSDCRGPNHSPSIPLACPPLDQQRGKHATPCGRVLCDACSDRRLVLPQEVALGAVRVCAPCAARVEAAGEEAVRAVETVGGDSPPQLETRLQPSSQQPDALAPLPAPAHAVSVVAAPAAVPVATVTPAAAARPALAVAAAAPAAKAPVQATAPQLRPPTAAPVSPSPTAAAAPSSSASSSSSSRPWLLSSLAAKLEKKVEKHAPGLVAAVKEQISAAASKDEAQRAEKAALQAKLLAAAEAPVASPASSASPSSAPAAAAPAAKPGQQVAHIPGLGAVALAAAPENEARASGAGAPREGKSDAWSAMHARAPSASATSAHSLLQPASEPVLPSDEESEESLLSAVDGGELRRRGAKAAPVADSAALASSPASASAAVSSASQAERDPASLKLDLPLRLCLVILKKTSGEMRERYASYLQTKAARQDGDMPLSFAQFMFFSTIRTLPDFLFQKTELAFCMMRREHESLVHEENFVRYAPILTPLASKIDAPKLFRALQQASINSGAALTQQQVEQEEEAMALEAEEAEALGTESATGASDANTPRRKLRAGGVAFVHFKSYVDALKKYTVEGSKENGWPEFRAQGGGLTLDPHEQLLLVRTGVLDTTSFPPHIGRMAITTNFLLWESALFTRRRCIRWSNIARIEWNEEGIWRGKGSSSSASAASSSAAAQGDSKSHGASSSTPASGGKGMRIYVLDDSDSSGGDSSSLASGVVAAVTGGARKELCLCWEIPGWSSESQLERVRTFAHCQTMLQLHRLAPTLADKVLAAALVQETCMSLLRMRALESVGHGCDPLLLNPFAHTSDVQALSGAAAAASAGSAASSGSIDPAASTPTPLLPSPTASARFVSSIQSSISRADQIRKSKSSWLYAVLPGLQNREAENLACDIDPEVAAGQYRTAEELLALQRAHAQPFSLKNFAYNVKLFRHEIEPLVLLLALVRRVRDWENPLVTLATVLLLLNMSYRNLLGYLPALLVLFNIALVALLRYYPNAVWVALGGAAKEAEEAAAAAAAGGSGGSAGGGAHIEELDSEGNPRSDHDMMDGAGSMPTAQPILTSSSSSSGSSSGSGSGSGSAGGSSSSAVAPPPHKKEKDSDPGLLARLKNYRDVAVRTKEYLHSVQNSVAEQNVKMMKVEGLYKWRTPQVTQRFFFMLCAVFVVLVFVPFRFIFPFIVLDFFTTKWQRQSTIERLLEEVALPPRMPDLD